MTQKGVNKIFNKYKFDSVMILGDRIERLPIVSAALAYRKFIFHIHGVRLPQVLWMTGKTYDY